MINTSIVSCHDFYSHKYSREHSLHANETHVTGLSTFNHHSTNIRMYTCVYIHIHRCTYVCLIYVRTCVHTYLLYTCVFTVMHVLSSSSTYGDLECINYCFPTQFLPVEAQPGAQYCGRVFAEIGTDPIPTWVLNNTRNSDTGEYLKFFITAQVIFRDFNGLGLTGLAVTGFCQQAALKLLCRYIFPTCDPAFTSPTYNPICRRACYTLEDFLCKDFFIGLKLAITNQILDVSTIDPPLCSPLKNTEAGNAPMCLSTLDGGELYTTIACMYVHIYLCSVLPLHVHVHMYSRFKPPILYVHMHS